MRLNETPSLLASRGVSIMMKLGTVFAIAFAAVALIATSPHRAAADAGADLAPIHDERSAAAANADGGLLSRLLMLDGVSFL
jgi:hypothetical protein